MRAVVALLAVAACGAPPRTDRMIESPDGAAGFEPVLDAGAGAAGAIPALRHDGASPASGAAPDQRATAPADAAPTAILGPDQRAPAPADSAILGGPGPCGGQATELCEDFESGAIDTKVWTVGLVGSAKVLVDGEHVHGGKFALHIKAVPGLKNSGGLTETVTFPARNNVFYTRIWAYFTPDLASGPGPAYHQGFIIVRGKNSYGDVALGLGSHGDRRFLGYNIYYASPMSAFDEFGKASRAPIPPDKWLCVEMMSDGSGPLVRRIWVDGVELPELYNSHAALPTPKFASVFVGLAQYHATPTLTDMWVDDVRVSAERIGCN